MLFCTWHMLVQQNAEVPQKCPCLCFDCSLYNLLNEFMGSIDTSKNSLIRTNSRKFDPVKFNPAEYDGTFNPSEPQADSF
ncbi:hypothetical protein WN943_011340 [Citrus x changshan-huyou]